MKPAQVDELEFDLKTKPGKGSAKATSLVETAIQASQNEVAAESSGKSKSSKSKSNKDENVFQKQEENVALDVIEEATTTKKPKKTTTTTTRPDIVTTGSRYEEMMRSRHAEKEQYFGKDVFDRDGAKSADNRIVLLNDSVYKYVKPSLQTSIVYNRWDVHRIFLVFFFFILAGNL